MLNSQGRLERIRPSDRKVPAPLRAVAGRVAMLGAVLCLGMATPARAQVSNATPPDSAQASVPRATVSGIIPLPNAGTMPKKVPSPPSDLHDLPAWLDYRTHAHVQVLPYQARLFYRNGLLQYDSGNREEAMRLVHGAADLDPGFFAPHLTLAAWMLTRNPSEALQQYSIVLDLVRKNFITQLAIVANGIYVALQAVLIALVVAGLLLVALHQADLRHAWYERLARFLSPRTSYWWTWALLVLPFFLGLGPVLPTVVFLGLLWPLLKLNERVVFVLLVVFLGSAPLTISALDRLAMPLRPQRAPFFGVTLVEGVPFQRSMHDELAALARAHPDNAFVQFALGWSSRRAGDPAQVEAAYRQVLALEPKNDRALNNLGNALAMKGDQDGALASFREAVEINPSNMAALFNLSQILTLRYEYRDATEALSRASALDFEMVKAYQAQQTEDGYLPLVEQWIAPSRFWAALKNAPLSSTKAPSLPPAWRSRVEFSGWPFSATALVVAVLALVFGMRQNRSIPLRGCSNCGSVICRRCAERRRELALCPQCVAIEARAESGEFARVLLNQRRRQRQRAWHLVRTALATLIPGFGLLAFRRLLPAFAIMIAAAATATVWLGLAGPFPYEAGLTLPSATVPLALMVFITALLYVVSMLGYYGNVARERAQAAYIASPSRSRATQATGRSTAVAA